MAIKVSRVDKYTPGPSESNVTGVVQISQGGTGATDASTAINNLLPDQTGQQNKVLASNGLYVVWSTITNGGVTANTSPTITTVVVTDSLFNALDDTAVDTSGGYIKITGTEFVSGCSVLIGTTNATSVSFVSHTELNVQIPAMTAGTYIVYVVNPDGGTAIRVNGLTISAFPAWQTSSSLPDYQVDESISITLSASEATVYSLQAGSTLPSGLSLTSGGTLSGTVTGLQNDTLYSFTIVATDPENQNSPRTFSISIVVGDPYFKYTTLLIRNDNSSTSFAKDASSNNFEISVAGDVKGSGMSPALTGWSNYFDGTGDYLSLASNAAFGFDGTSFTVEAWVNFFSASGQRCIATNYQSSTSGWAIQLFNGVIGVNLSGDGFDITGTTTIVANKWYHIALSGSAGSVKLFVNGVQEGSTYTGAMTTNSTSSLLIGQIASSAYLQGFISNLRIVKGNALYTANFTPSATPLTAIANTSLLTCSSNRLIDGSSNNFTVTKNGDVIATTNNPFNLYNTGSTGSAYFDGTSDYLDVPSNAAFGYGTGDFTIEFWTYLTTISASTPNLVDQRSGASTQVAPTLYLNNGVLTYYVNGTNRWTGATLAANIWYHIALCRSSGVTKIYVNGTQSGSSYTDTNNYIASPIRIFGSNDGGTLVTQAGYVSNFRVVKGTAVYTANFTPPTEQLTAVSGTSLLTCQYRQGPNNNTFLDKSKNNVLVTRNGNSTYSTFTPFYNNYSVYFDGTSDYLSLASSSLFAVGATFTIECWFFPLSHSGSLMMGTVGTAAPQLGWQNSTTFGLASVSTAWRVTTTTLPTLNSWNHVAVVRTGTGSNETKIYLNGSLVVTGTASDAFTTNTGFTIGAASDNTSGFNGYISNARVVKGSAVYTGNFTPSTTPLTSVSGTSLLTCQSNRFIDNSGNNLVITKNGDAQVVKFSPFTLNAGYTYASMGTSMYFDGTGDYLSIASNPVMAPGANDFTIEAWVYPTSALSTYNTLLETNVTGGLFFGKITNGYGVRTAGTADLVAVTAPAIQQWTHVAATRIGSVLSVFINGELKGTVANTANFGQGSVTIAANSAGSNTFPGYINNFRLVKGQSLYMNGFTVPTAGLTAITGTSLLTCNTATIVDNSTNAFTITVNGNSAVNTDDPFSGANDYSVYFDGSGDYLSIPDNDAFNFGSSNFTIELWVKRSVTAQTFLLNQWESGANSDTNSAFVVQITAASLFSCSIAYNNSTTQVQITGTTTVVNGTWYHVAVAREGVSLVLYVNGRPEAATTVLSTLSVNNSNLPVYIGARRDGTLPLTGYVSNARIVKGTALYTTTFTPPVVGAITPAVTTEFLLTSGDAGVYDMTGNSIIETVANSKASSTQTKYLTASTYFDGTGDYLIVRDSNIYELSNSDWTIESWIYLASNAGEKGIISKYNSSNIGFNIRYSASSGGIRSVFGSSAGATDSWTETWAPTAGVWYHLAFVRSGTSYLVFVNGTQVGTTRTFTNATTIGDNADSLVIGTSQTVASSDFYGYISDMRITKGVARYTSNFTAPTTSNRTR